METAKAEILENLQQLRRVGEPNLERLKSDINDLLVQYLPPNITIEELEALALGLHSIITDPRKYLIA